MIEAFILAESLGEVLTSPKYIVHDLFTMTMRGKYVETLVLTMAQWQRAHVTVSQCTLGSLTRARHSSQ